MKKHLSVLMLYLSAPFYKILAVLAAMAAVELAGYHLLGYRQEAIFGHNSSDFLFTVSFVCYLAVLVLLILGPHRKNSFGYTLQRLRISERAAFGWNVLANGCYLTLLWMVQMLVVLFLARQCMADPAYLGGPQGVYVDIYRSNYLHALIPLKDDLLWSRNVVMLLALAVAAAYMALSTRYGKTGILGAMTIGATVIFSHDIYNGPESLGMYMVLILAPALSMVADAGNRCHRGVRRWD